MDTPDELTKLQLDLPEIRVIPASPALIDWARKNGFIHAGAKPGGGDAFAPTTIIADRTDTVRFFFRPTHVVTRLGAAEALRIIDERKIGE